VGVDRRAGGRVMLGPIMLSPDVAATAGMPGIIRSPLELDGYLTGVIVTPQAAAIPLQKWVAGLWRKDETIFDDLTALKAMLDVVVARRGAVEAEIDRALDRLEADKICRYRPSFLSRDSKPEHDSVRLWARGFFRAMSLALETWTPLLEGERDQILLAPFVGFFEPEGSPLPASELAEDIDDRLDEAAAAIPRATLLLRKLARLRSAKLATSAPIDRRPRKIGRNDPCPCGSGQKYKRCCAQT
jgi:uncharacterized protein